MSSSGFISCLVIVHFTLPVPKYIRSACALTRSRNALEPTSMASALARACCCWSVEVVVVDVGVVVVVVVVLSRIFLEACFVVSCSCRARFLIFLGFLSFC